MAINVKRLRAFAGGAGAPGLPLNPPFAESTAEPMEVPYMPDLMLDSPDNLSPEAQVHRLREPQVAYIEIEGGWGDAGCGGCKYIHDNFCVKTQVMSHVSPEKGCCNFFEPRDVPLIAPEYWSAIDEMKDADMHNSEVKEDDSDDHDDEPDDDGEDEEDDD